MQFFLPPVYAEKETQLSRYKYMVKLFTEQENLGMTSMTICHTELPLIYASNRFLINTITFFLFSSVIISRASAGSE